VNRYLTFWQHKELPGHIYWWPVNAGHAHQNNTYLAHGRHFAKRQDKRQADEVQAYWSPRENFYTVGVEPE
jgi:hypothetical protein